MYKIVNERSAPNSAAYSSSIPLRILILEDNPDDVELSIQEMKNAGFEILADVVDTEEGFAARLQSCAYDLILSDYRLPTWSGVEAFHLLKQGGKDIPFILITGTLGEEAAVDLIKKGITDYILKDRLVRLPSAIHRALEDKTIRDERERATRALRESEERVRLLLDSTAEAIFGIDPQGICIFCNPACVRLLGYDEPDDLIGKEMHSLIHHGRAEGAAHAAEDCTISETFREGKGIHIDDEILWKRDGSSFPAEYWSYPMLQVGKPIGSVVTFLDITDRKRTEEHAYQVVQAIQSSSDLIAMSDSNGNFVFANQAFLETLGYSNEEVIGSQFRVVMSPHNSVGFLEEFSEKISQPGGWAGECLLVRRDGSDLLAYLNVGPVTDKRGNVVGSFGIAQDIRERKQTEENLRRLAEIVENSEDAIIRKTLDGTIVSWNGGAERMYGYSATETIGQPISMLCPPEQRDEIPALMEKVKRGQIVEHCEATRLRKDGKQIRVALTVSPIRDGSGRIAGASAIARDITESKQMEEMFRQAQKMEAVGRLAGGIAHDFNNLLGVIIGYGELVEDRMHSNDPLRPKVEEIKKAGQRAARLTRQLLAFSRQQILEPRILSLNSVVTDVQKMLQRLIGEDIELITVLSPTLDSVKADQGQIEQIIMNLAVNSRDAMPEGGTLTIETANVDLDELYTLGHPGLIAGSYVMLRVTDTGTGMDTETQKHIFEPFFTTKEQGKGTGLGLATVYGVVKQSGGYVSVTSELGQGTTFHIYLPQIQAPVEVMEEQSVGPNNQFKGTETILLVEDEESLRKLAREVLLENHYNVLEASNGFEALEIAKQHKGPIHLLLTDVVMPRMGGPALAKQLAIENPGIKVLYMSGYTGGSTTVQALANDQAQFLHKPFTPATLSRKLRETLGVLEEQAISSSSSRMERE